MGTSRNDPSPNKPEWRLSRTILGSDRPASEQVRQIWRAAERDQGRALVTSLGAWTVFQACDLAAHAPTPVGALEEFDTRVAERREASLAIEFAKRALARATYLQNGSLGFASELFAEATAYYAARDLPSVIGAPGHASSATAVLQLKNDLRAHARERVGEIGLPPSSAEAWPAYVTAVVSGLQEATGSAA